MNTWSLAKSSSCVKCKYAGIKRWIFANQDCIEVCDRGFFWRTNLHVWRDVGDANSACDCHWFFADRSDVADQTMKTFVTPKIVRPE